MCQMHLIPHITISHYLCNKYPALLHHLLHGLEVFFFYLHVPETLLKWIKQEKIVSQWSTTKLRNMHQLTPFNCMNLCLFLLFFLACLHNAWAFPLHLVYRNVYCMMYQKKEKKEKSCRERIKFTWGISSGKYKDDHDDNRWNFQDATQLVPITFHFLVSNC